YLSECNRIVIRTESLPSDPDRHPRSVFLSNRPLPGRAPIRFYSLFCSFFTFLPFFRATNSFVFRRASPSFCIFFHSCRNKSLVLLLIRKTPGVRVCVATALTRQLV